METSVVEVSYPISFRAEDAKKLGEYLRARHSVELVGMKRVGISNFLRFFLYHKDIVGTYIGDGGKHLFIPIDLNDLVEREIFPFWTLTLKRIADTVETQDVPNGLKKQSRRLFMESIQIKDLFFTFDSVTKLVSSIIKAGILPTLFFIRFDRLRDAVQPEFFDNLQGLKDASHQKLSYVFTSFRDLDSLAPEIFRRPSLSVFSKTMYMKPAKEKDSSIILKTFEERYHMQLLDTNVVYLIDNAGGHVQYLQLALIKLHEENLVPQNRQDLFSELIRDERIVLQSEELFDSLTHGEQEVLLRVKREEVVEEEEKKHARYLWDTGFVHENDGERGIFSPLFDYYLGEKKHDTAEKKEFTKKEHLLFTFLRDSEGQICEREDIVEAVWPEYSEIGVSDWAIDRLVARLRNKLKLQGNTIEIQTVRTRGYKLIGGAVLK